MQERASRLLIVVAAIATVVSTTAPIVSAQVPDDTEPTAVRARIDTEPGAPESTFGIDLIAENLASDYEPGEGVGDLALEANTWHELGDYFEGEYALVLQSLPPDFEARSVDCRSDAAGAYEWDDGRVAEFELGGFGGTIECEFEVEYVDASIGPRGHIEVSVAAPGAPNWVTRVSIQPGALPDGYRLGKPAQGRDVSDFDSYEVRYVLPGPWTVAVEELEQGLRVDMVACIGSDETTSWQVLDLEVSDRYGQRAVTFDVTPGLSVRCEVFVEKASELPSPGPDDSLFGDSSVTEPGTADPSAESNEPVASPEPVPDTTPMPEPTESDDPADEVPAPRPGRWRSVVAASSIDCGPASAPLLRQVDVGPIQVKNGGRRIVIVATPKRIVLDQVGSEPGHYKGTLDDRSTGRVIPLK